MRAHDVLRFYGRHWRGLLVLFVLALLVLSPAAFVHGKADEPFRAKFDAIIRGGFTEVCIEGLDDTLSVVERKRAVEIGLCSKIAADFALSNKRNLSKMYRLLSDVQGAKYQRVLDESLDQYYIELARIFAGCGTVECRADRLLIRVEEPKQVEAPVQSPEVPAPARWCPTIRDIFVMMNKGAGNAEHIEQLMRLRRQLPDWGLKILDEGLEKADRWLFPSTASSVYRACKVQVQLMVGDQ